jgi:hypothetical protein
MSIRSSHHRRAPRARRGAERDQRVALAMERTIRQPGRFDEGHSDMAWEVGLALLLDGVERLIATGRAGRPDVEPGRPAQSSSSSSSATRGARYGSASPAGFAPAASRATSASDSRVRASSSSMCRAASGTWSATKVRDGV